MMAEVQPLQLVPEEVKSSVTIENGTDITTSSGQRRGEEEGSSTTGPQAHRFNPDFTRNVISATGPKTSPRMRKVMASLIQHVHDFARENEITVDEWMAGVEMVKLSPSKVGIFFGS